MPTRTYTAEINGETYRLRADFSQAASQIERDTEDGEWIATGRQVADFSHSPDAAMREELTASYPDGPWADDEFDIEESIDEMESE